MLARYSLGVPWLYLCVLRWARERSELSSGEVGPVRKDGVALYTRGASSPSSCLVCICLQSPSPCGRQLP